MLSFAEERLSKYCPTLVRGNFKDIESIATTHNFSPVSGVLFDLGISSLHYTELARGFSFKNPDEALDMRLAPLDTSVTAAMLLNTLSVSQLTELFTPVLGRKAGRVAKVIDRARKQRPFEKVGDITTVLHHELSEVFLALRIAVNSEFDSIDEGITGAFSILKPGGRIVVISFHSLEDKRVVRLFKDFERASGGVHMTKDPIVPSEEEVSTNPKARSALMRVFLKI
jgi:16S rRNA (cytosine1402-N4)-methyltransferase